MSADVRLDEAQKAPPYAMTLPAIPPLEKGDRLIRARRFSQATFRGCGVKDVMAKSLLQNNLTTRSA